MADREEILLQASRFRVVRVPQAGAPESGEMREIVRHPGAVTILPLVDSDRICLIKNHRVSVGKTLIELPAGTLEPGEDPRETAVRELSEETGYRAGRLEPLSEFYLSPGILDERMHLFLADELTAGKTDHQPDEQIENHVVALDEALSMIHRGEIEDAKTIVGLLFYDRLRRETE